MDPKLSICIPTYNRLPWLKKCLRAAFRQLRDVEPGLVEIVVSDNASTDGTGKYLDKIQSDVLCVHHHPENIGSARNFPSVIDQAHGEFVWLMGDDDELLPGALRAVLGILECQVEWVIPGLVIEHQDGSKTPCELVSGYKPDVTPVWMIDDTLEMIQFSNQANSLAAFGGLISVLIGKRQLLLEGYEATWDWSTGCGFEHIAALLHASARPGSALAVIPEPLVLYREYNDSNGQRDPWARIMLDLKAWIQMRDMDVDGMPRFPTQEAKDAWCGVVRRHHGFSTLPTLRMLADDQHSWPEAKQALLSVGYHPDAVAVADAIGIRLRRKP